MTVWTENFDGANKAPTAGYQLTWTELNYGIGNNSNTAIRWALHGHQRADDPGQFSDGYVQAETRNAGSYEGVTFRIQDDANFYVAFVDNGANLALLQKRVSNTFTTLRSGSVTPAAGKIVKAEFSGTTLKLIFDGVQVGADVVDSTYSSGYAGIRLHTSGSRIDNFECSDGGGAVTTKRRVTFPARYMRIA